ncbi:MAG: ribosome maturation factor RimM [Bdellovibrio bacteriovorus]
MAKRVVLGRIVGVYGVRGWIKVYSETEPREAILDYSPWLVGPSQAARQVIEGRRHGKGVVARLAGCDDRDQAALLVDQEIAVERAQLPPTAPDEWYWADLEGLEVWGPEGVRLGVVDHLFSTGVNDVLVVTGERERLIPFAWGEVIRSVDLARGRIEVNWDPDF